MHGSSGRKYRQREDLGQLLRGLNQTAVDIPVVLPLHPRTRKKIEEYSLQDFANRLRIIDPVSFLDMIALERGARVIATDSGGVQKEAYFHGVPCITLRNETEWGETVEHGWNVLAGIGGARINELVKTASSGSPIGEYGDGTTATTIMECIRKWQMGQLQGCF